ncbi:MAG: carboxylesterase family protein [Acidobacteriia bacterium]|nr:carboxylesterase family protein [Terriglobia bacterium]
MARACFALAILLPLGAASAAVNEPVHLDTGLVSGVAGKDAAVRVFKGLPFAAPPVANLRWAAPKPAAHWDGVRQAGEFGSICMQGQPGGRGRGGAAPARMSEDCLYLNVWTAAQSAGDKRPVLVWFHPGGFTGGSGSSPATDGEALAKKGLIVVTMNYRLGVFGFFAHPELTQESDRHASGNYGLMDQIAALQWVQKNIAAFGGDPKRVTIDGDSAGAMSVGDLVASPLAKGLFQRAIAESGSYLGLSVTPMRTLADAEQAGKKSAEAIGASTLSDLRARPADEILGKLRAAGNVIVDGWLLPENPAGLFSQGKQNDVPLLVGSNKDEGTFFVRGGTADQFLEQSRRRFGDLTDTFLKLYPAGSDEEALASRLAAFRDELGFVMRKWAQVQTKTAKSKAYLYYFTHEPPAGGGASPRGGFASGATHGAEAQYVFENLLGDRSWTALDRQLADTISSYWVNFAATGDPNGKSVPRWPAYNGNNSVRPMVLGDQVEVGAPPNPSQLAFYEALYAKVTSR